MKHKQETPKILLKVMMKSGSSFVIECTGWEIEKDMGTQLIKRFSLWGTDTPPYLDLTEIEAILKVRG